MSESSFTWHPVELTPGPEGDGPDVDTVLEIIRAADLAVAGRCDETRESVRAMLASSETLRDETRILRDAHGSPAGLLLVEHTPEANRSFLELYAVPRHAEDLYPLLLDVGSGVASRHAETRPWELHTACFSGDELCRRAFEDRGFTSTRHFWRMRIDFQAGAVPSAPPAPFGVTLRVVDGEADQRLLHEIDELAFSEHFGFTARPYDEWIQWFEHRSDARPDLWWLAYLDGEPVGLCIGDDSRADDGLAYIRVLGVIPAARGQGIARWLLGTSFAQAAREGRRGALLTVDSGNTTGAVRLYEAAGMRTDQVIDVYRRELS